jgi:hypothetical protein
MEDIAGRGRSGGGRVIDVGGGRPRWDESIALIVAIEAGAEAEAEAVAVAAGGAGGVGVGFGSGREKVVEYRRAGVGDGRAAT